MDVFNIESTESSDIDPFIKGVQCCAPDLARDQNGYLVSYKVDKDMIDSDEYNNVE